MLLRGLLWLVSILCLVVVWLELGHTVSCEAVSRLDIDRSEGLTKWSRFENPFVEEDSQV